MMILILRKHKRAVWLMAGLLVLMLGSGIWWLQRDDRTQAKADRSNAMQVTTAVLSEPAAPVISTDFFTEYRLERDKMRSEKSDMLRETIKTAKTDDIRQKAQDSVLKMVQEKQCESEMESLIKARGFADALVFYRDHSVSAIVKASVLSRDEVIQVADVISRVAGVKPEDITISAKP